MTVPTQRGWAHRAGDPESVQRWFDGAAWTNRFTGGTHAEQAGAERIGSSPHPRDEPPPAIPTGSRVPLRRHAEELPAVTSTVLITMFFGLFGLIPAAINTTSAAINGQPTDRYWGAFFLTLVVEALVVLLVWAAVAGIG